MTLEKQSMDKLNMPGRPIRPIEQAGLTRRKKQNSLTAADTRYFQELEEYKIKMRYYVYPNYDELEKEYNSKERSCSILYFMDNYEKIKHLEKKGKINFIYIRNKIIDIFKEITNVEYKPSEESDSFLYLLLNYFFDTDSKLGKVENALFQRTLNLGGKDVPFPPNENKGLMIIGLTGIAKTTFVECIIKLQSDIYEPIQDENGQMYDLRNFTGEYRNIQMVSAREITEIKKIDPDRYAKLKKAPNLFIDDLLAEDKSYGNWIASDFIEERYKLKVKTHIIVNYEPCQTIEGVINAIGLRYGKRVDSRQFEMFNIVALRDKDKRLSKYS